MRSCSSCFVSFLGHWVYIFKTFEFNHLSLLQTFSLFNGFTMLVKQSQLRFNFCLPFFLSPSLFLSLFLPSFLSFCLSVFLFYRICISSKQRKKYSCGKIVIACIYWVCTMYQVRAKCFPHSISIFLSLVKNSEPQIPSGPSASHFLLHFLECCFSHSL